MTSRVERAFNRRGVIRGNDARVAVDYVAILRILAEVHLNAGNAAHVSAFDNPTSKDVRLAEAYVQLTAGFPRLSRARMFLLAGAGINPELARTRAVRSLSKSDLATMAQLRGIPATLIIPPSMRDEEGTQPHEDA
jgi:hypothetical protein